MKMWRTGVRRLMVVLAAVAAVLTCAATAATAATAAQPTSTAATYVAAPLAGDQYGCPSEDACLYTDKTDVIGSSHPHTNYKYYGYDNFSDVTGYHWIDNNQIDGARVYLCLGYNGTDCKPFTVDGVSHPYIQAGYLLNYNLTPINSIKLCPSSGC